MSCPDTLSEKASHDVSGLVWSHRYKEVCTLYVRPLQIRQERRTALHGQNLQMMACSLELLSIGIHQDDILLLVGEHLRQVRPDLPGASDDYSHGLSFIQYD